MTRIFGDFVYGAGPRDGCWWDETCDLPDGPSANGDLACDVAIIGGGFTGLNAALEFARRGRDVLVLEAAYPGWGASGRNGGFCCLGGGKLSDAAMDQRLGRAARLEWRRAEKQAVDQVLSFLAQTGAEADLHSQGETLLAHRARDMRAMEAEVAAVRENYGVEAELHDRGELDRLGMAAGFFGGVTTPIGKGLNPRKYLAALLDAVLASGARVAWRSPVERISEGAHGWALHTDAARISAQQVLVATNGYSSETVPDWLRGRYIPTQSSVLVTRPMTDDELAAQGWTSGQMCYDSRNLLHYFRLMPDNRMLFGMRGGLGGTAASEARARARVDRHFRKMFPAWSGVELTHHWSGMVCIAEQFLPYVGPLPGAEGLWCAMCYHGNGVSMGSFSGHLAARAMTGDDQRPVAIRNPLSRFPASALRRYLLWPAYVRYMLTDL